MNNTTVGSNKIRSFEDLLAWQKSMDLVDQIYVITRKFPKDETYGLTSQIRRSAVSIPSNIAEGSIRNSLKDFIRFIAISRGSLAELKTQTLIAQRQNFITHNESNKIIKNINEIGRMLTGLSQSLNNKLVGSK